MPSLSPRRTWTSGSLVRNYFILIALALLPVSAFIFGAHKLLLRGVTSRMTKQSSQTARIVAGLMENHLNQSRVVVESFATRPALSHLVSTGQYDAAVPHLQEARRLRPDFESVALYDLKGELKAVAPARPDLVGQNARESEWFRAVTKDWQPYVSGLYRDESKAETWMAATIVPVRDPAGTPVALLVAPQSVESVTKEVYGLQTGESTTQILFMDRNGQTIGRKNKAVVLVKAPPEIGQLVSRRSPSIEGRFMPIAGENSLVAASPIGSFGWTLILQLPETALRKALWDYEKNLAWLGVIIGLVALGGGAFVAYLYQRVRAGEERVRVMNAELEVANAQLEMRNREVEHATKLKSAFLASVSHELRTPLNAIIGFSGLLSQQAAGDLNAKQLRFVNHIETGSTHLLQLINDILDLSKIESGQMELHCEDALVEEVLPEVLSTIKPLAMPKHIELMTRVDGAFHVHADRIKFKQILYNLLSNAIKFTPEGGTVSVDCFDEVEFVRIAVSDTGIGISPQDLKVIFDEFRQVADSTHGVKEGTGLGLAITRKLVEGHGGTMQVRSELNKGSEFSFTLPKQAQTVAGRQASIGASV
jgi:signal transduction histidine kinase